MKYHNAAFINIISEEGSRAEAIEWLSRTWSELVNLKTALVKQGFTYEQLEKMCKGEPE